MPRGFFTGKTWEINLKTAEGAYAMLFDGMIQLCFGLASNAYWKAISLSVSSININFFILEIMMDF